MASPITVLRSDAFTVMKALHYKHAEVSGRDSGRSRAKVRYISVCPS